MKLFLVFLYLLPDDYSNWKLILSFLPLSKHAYQADQYDQRDHQHHRDHHDKCVNKVRRLFREICMVKQMQESSVETVFAGLRY